MSYWKQVKKKTGATTGTIKNSTKHQVNALKKSPGKVLLDPQHGTRAASEMTEKALTGDIKATNQFGKAFGGKSAADRAAGALYAVGATYQTGNPWIIGGAAIVGGATGKEAIDKGLTGQPVEGPTGGSKPSGKLRSPEHQALIDSLANPSPASAPTAAALPQFQGYTPTGLSVANIDPETLKAKAVADMQSPDPIVAAQAAEVLGIDPSTLPQVQAQMTQIGGPSQFLQGQQDLVKTLQSRVAGTAGPSLAELQMKKAQQDMINQMAAQAGSMSGRALPAAQRQLMQAQQQSGQQLAMDAAILRAQEQQQAEAQLAGALGQYRGQDIQRTGLDLDSQIANQSSVLSADIANQSTLLGAEQANYEGRIDLALGNLDAETKALIANQNIDLETKKANLLKDTTLSEADLNIAFKAAEANQKTDLDALKFDEIQKREAAKIAELARIEDIKATINREDLEQRERDSIRTAKTSIAIGEMKGTQASQGRKEDMMYDVSGEVIKGLADYGIKEYLGSDSDDLTDAQKAQLMGGDK